MDCNKMGNQMSKLWKKNKDLIVLGILGILAFIVVLILLCPDKDKIIQAEQPRH